MWLDSHCHVTADEFAELQAKRYQQTVFILDLAVPRDFDPAIDEFLGVYLYTVDDLKGACDKNRRAREQEWPKAERIIEDETARFKTLAEATFEAIILHADQLILDCNPSAAQLLRYEERELAGMELARVFSAETIDRIASGEPEPSRGEAIDRDGHPVPVAIRTKPMPARAIW